MQKWRTLLIQCLRSRPFRLLSQRSAATAENFFVLYAVSLQKHMQSWSALPFGINCLVTTPPASLQLGLVKQWLLQRFPSVIFSRKACFAGTADRAAGDDGGIGVQL